MYLDGEKKVPTGMARWFSVENWRDGDNVDRDGRPIVVKRILHLTNYVRCFQSEKWISIVKGALELRAKVRNNRRKRKGKESACAAIEVASPSDDEWDYNDVFSDPAGPSET